MQNAIIRGEVCFRVGDDTDGSRGSTAITRDEYDRYVTEGKLRPGEE